MWNGKNKAITFSFDDGVTQDARCVEILNKYGLKATFNINSALLGKEGKLCNGKRTVRHDKIDPQEVSKIYAGHEVAVHTLTHPNLTKLPEEEVIRQIEEDRKNLEKSFWLRSGGYGISRWTLRRKNDRYYPYKNGCTLFAYGK